MKKIFLYCLIILFAGSATSLFAQNLSAQKKKQIHQEILKSVEAKPSAINSMALRKVFTPTFYRVEVLIHLSSESYQTINFLTGETDSGFVFLESPGTTETLPGLQKLIKADFKLKTQEDGNVFMEALNALFPAITEKDDSNIIKHDGTHWQFICGKFFDNYKGFVVATDANGSISEIGYSLEITSTSP